MKDRSRASDGGGTGLAVRGLTMSERTLAGLHRARKAGKGLGRPTADVDMQKVQRRLDRGESLRAIAADLGCSAALLCKRRGMGSMTLQDRPTDDAWQRRIISECARPDAVVAGELLFRP